MAWNEYMMEGAVIQPISSLWFVGCKALVFGQLYHELSKIKVKTYVIPAVGMFLASHYLNPNLIRGSWTF